MEFEPLVRTPESNKMAGHDALVDRTEVFVL